MGPYLKNNHLRRHGHDLLILIIQFKISVGALGPPEAPGPNSVWLGSAWPRKYSNCRRLRHRARSAPLERSKWPLEPARPRWGARNDRSLSKLAPPCSLFYVLLQCLRIGALVSSFPPPAPHFFLHSSHFTFSAPVSQFPVPISRFPLPVSHFPFLFPHFPVPMCCGGI